MSKCPEDNSTDQNCSAQVRFLRQPEVLARVGVTWMTVLRWEEAELFPKRRKIGPNTVAWVESEIDEWCANKAAQVSGEGE